MTSPRAARLQLGSSGSTFPRSPRAPPHRRAPAPRAPSRSHSSRPRPRAPRSLRLPAPSAAEPGPGVGELWPPAPAPSPPTRTAPSSLLSLLLAFPAARVFPARKSSSQLFLPERAQRAQAEGRLLRPCSLSCLCSRRRSSGSGRHKVAAGGPPPPTSAIPPGLLCSAPLPRDSPGLRWLSLSSCSVRSGADSRAGIAAETSLPFRLLGLLPSAPPPPATGINSLGNWGSAAAAEDSLSVRNSRAPTGPCKQVNAVWGGGVGPAVGGRLHHPGALPMIWAKAGNANWGSAARDADWALRARGGRAAGVFRRGGCRPR